MNRHITRRTLAAFMAMVITTAYTIPPAKVYANENEHIITDQEVSRDVIIDHGDAPNMSIDQGDELISEPEIVINEPEDSVNDAVITEPEITLLEPEDSVELIPEAGSDDLSENEPIVDEPEEVENTFMSQETTSWEGLQTAINNASEGDIITLLNDIKCNNNDSIKVNGKKVIVDLNGYKMDRKRSSSDGDGHVFNVKNHGELTLRDSVGTGMLTGGYATDGGGIKIEKDSTCIIDGNVTVSGNKASKDGGGIYAWGTLIMNGGVITGNKAEDEGGGIYVEYTGKLELSGVHITDNHSDDDGGGLNVHLASDGSITNCFITGNSSGTDGGGLKLNSDKKTLTVSKTEISGNTAADQGGGINVDSGTLAMEDGSINDNTAVDGGGIYNDNSTIRLYNVPITGNKTIKYAGAGINNKGNATVTSCRINKNTSVLGGAGIYTEKVINIENCIIDENISQSHGGGICVDNGGRTVLSGNNIRNNTGIKAGGGIYVGSKGSVDINGVNTMTENAVSDIYLVTGRKLNITAPLSDGNIKSGFRVVFEAMSGVFTEGFSKYNAGEDPVDYFVPEIGYSIVLDDNGEARFISSLWGRLQHDIDTASENAVINLDEDYKAKPEDKTLTIPQGKTITINLNGHKLDRGLSSYKENGETITVKGNLTIIDLSEAGGGKVCGGYGAGGGVSVEDGAEFILENGSITGNTGNTGGGGIRVSNGGSATIDAGKVENNNAPDGGGIYSEGSVEIRKTAVINANNASGKGGGIFLAGGQINNLADVLANHANIGGGIYIDGGTLNLNGGSITKNTASTEAGGIWHGSSDTSALNIMGAPSVSGNASVIGKNILIKGGSVIDVTGNLEAAARVDVTTDTTAAPITGDLGDNVSETDALKIFTYEGGNDRLEIRTEDNGKRIYLKNIESSKSIDSWEGLQAAINDASDGDIITLSKDIKCNNDDSIKVDGKKVIVDLNGHKMDRNRSSSDGDGHVFNAKNHGELTLRDSAGTGILTGGYATDGGGIKIEEDSTCIIEGGTIKGNKASKDGAGIYVWGTLRMTGGSVTNNEAADEGGGIYVEDTGTIELENVIISGNSSFNQNYGSGGGGLMLRIKHDSVISNCTIADNRAVQYRNNRDVLDLAHGGGICFDAHGKTLTVNNTVIRGNRADDYAGGIYLYSGRILMNGGELSGNSGDDAGGIMVTSNTTFTAENVSFSDNDSRSESGGGVNNKGTTQMTDCTFTNNRSSNDSGGAVYNKSQIMLTHCTFTGNRADSKGGAVFSKDDANIVNCTFDSNTAAQGGGIYQADNKMTILSANMIKNKAKSSDDLQGNGGAIYVEDGDTFIEGGNITENSAQLYGGGIFADDELRIKGALRVSDNANDNVYLHDKEKLNINGEIQGAVVYVSLADECGTFTKNLTTTNPDLDPANVFFSDNGYSVRKNGDGEGQLVDTEWPGLQKLINDTANKDTGSGEVPVLYIDRDWTGSGNDKMLSLPSGKRLVIDLNGHSINMNRSGKDKDGHVFIVNNGCSLTIRDSSDAKTGTIMGGWAEKGGAINLQTGATCRIESGNITGNKADKGGAVYVHGGSEFTVTGGSINDNKAVNGGGIYLEDEDADTAKAVVTGGIITGNTATIEAGGIFAGKRGELSVSGTPFVKGNEGAAGKNILLGVGNVLKITGALTAGDDSSVGAKIDVSAKSTDSTDESVSAKLTDGLTTSGSVADAGVIFTYNELSYETTLEIADGELRHRAITSDGRISNWKALQDYVNNSNNNGKTVALSADIDASGEDYSIKVDGDNVKVITIDLNGHKMDRKSSSSKGDGHVINVKDGATLTITDSIGTGIITGGNTNDEGGGIKIEKNSTCIIEGGTVTGNRSEEKDGFFSDSNGDGGGIFVKGRLIMKGGSVVGNYAEDTGGGIHCTDSGTFDIDNALISGNTSKNDGGGFIVHLGSDAIIKNSRVTGNCSETEDGGGMRVEAGSRTLTIIDTEISGNRAENNGGGMVIYAGRVVMENGKISGNKSEDGGGVYNDGGTIDFNGVEISNNISSKKGGIGINNRNNATLTDCNIIGNTGEADGGGIYTTNDMTIIGGSICANSVKGDGGGIYVKEGKIGITGTLIGLNRAGKDGGAIFTDGDIELKDCTLKENNANVSGGAIRVRDCSVTLDKCSLQDNSCVDYGGGIYIDDGDAKLTVKGGSITRNVSGLSGSGIFVDKDTDEVYISGNAEISDNLGGSDIYLTEDKELTVNGPLFAGEGDSVVYARIGVTTEDGLDTAFTEGYKINKGIEPSLIFFSNDKHEVYLKDGTEAAFKKAGKNEEDPNPFIPKSSQMERNWQKLKGSDWMSGLSGERYLNEVNLPGTHDSGTANIHGNTSTSYAAWIVKGLITVSNPLGGLISYFSDDVYTAFTDGFARCQRRYVDEQLQDGIRKFDFRVNTYHADNMTRSDNGKDLWIMHGKDKFMGTFYAKDHNGDPLTLAKVFDWIKEFLKENPTETVIIDIDSQGIDLDEDAARIRLQKHIRALSQEINPSTGEPYLYTEDGDYTKGLTRYPQLKECRGKIIYGLNRSAGIKNGVKDVFGSFHDDAKTKIKNLKDFYAQYGYDELPTDAQKAGFDYYLVAGTNGTNEPKDTPLDIADKVLPVLFGEGGLLTDRIGKFIGLVNMDGVNTKVTRQVWVTNFFDGIEYRTLTVKSGENDPTPKKYTVLKNTPITLPECIYDDPDQNGNYFQYWKVSDNEYYYPDDTFTVTDDVTFTAVWETSNSSSIRAVWNDGDNADGTRPVWLSVSFTREGKETEDNAVLRASENNWRKNFDYKISGIGLTPPEGYSYEVKGTTIYLTHTPEKTVHVSGSISWNDNDNNEGTRPDEVKLELYKNGGIVISLSANAVDNWNYDLGNLKLYDYDTEKNKITKITYTLKQKDKERKENIEGYSTYISGLNISGAEAGFEVLNVLQSNSTLLEGFIIWADDDVDGARRPQTVSVNLLRDASVVSTNEVSANENDEWLFAFALDNETPISSYSVSENKIDGYTSTISKTDRDGDGQVDGVVVINKHENHQHTIKEISEISKEATCDEPGERQIYEICTGCAETISSKTETIPALGHDWGKWITKRTATETQTGLVERECKRNSEHVESREVPKKGHVHEPEPVAGKAATCTEAGSKAYYHCAGCGLNFLDPNDPENTKIDIEKGEAVIPALGHDWGEWETVKEATEKEEGQEIRKCKRDATHTETRSIPKIKHVHKPEPVAGKAATCTEAGSKAYYHCAGCGLNFLDPNDPENTKIDIEKGEAVIPALGHDWGEWETVKEATEKEEGQEIRKCKRDATHTETRSIPKIKHVHKPEPVAGKAATCTEAGSKAYYHCAGCGLNFLDPNDPENTKIDIEKGEAVIPALGHDWGEWETVKEATEKEEGQERRKCKRNATHIETRQVKKKDPVKATYTVTAGDNQTWYKGTVNTVEFTFKRSYDDETTFSHFTGIKIDGKNVAGNYYTKAPGSVIIRLSPDYLPLLNVGTHTLVAEFDDGSADASFTVADRDINNNSSSSGSSSNSNSSFGSNNSSSSSGSSNSSSSSGSSNSGSSSGSNNSSSGSGSSNSSDILKNSNPIIPDTGNADNSNGSIGLNTGSSKMKGVNSVDKSMKGENRNIPVTGDSGTVIIWFALLFASLTVLVLVVRAGRKKSI